MGLFSRVLQPRDLLVPRHLAWWVFRWLAVGIQQLVPCVKLRAVEVAECSCCSTAYASCLRAHLVPEEPDSFLFLFAPPSVHEDIALSFMKETWGSKHLWLLATPSCGPDSYEAQVMLHHGLLRGKVALAGHPIPTLLPHPML